MDKVFVAIIVPFDGGIPVGIDNMNIRLFSSIVSAQRWVDEALADYYQDGIEVNWDIKEYGVR